MREETVNIIKVSCVYISAVIGAGFASGQEILKFFTSYYQGGFYGIILAAILFSLIGALVLDKVYKERIMNFNEFAIPVFGPFFGKIMNFLMIILMFFIFCIMISGSSTLIREEFGLNYSFSIFAMIVLCFVFMIFDMKGLITISTFVTPILIIGIFLTGAYIILLKDVSVFTNNFSSFASRNWVVSALLYVCYNSLISIVILTKLLPFLKSRRTAVAGGIIGGLMIGLLAIIINIGIYKFLPNVVSSELPLLEILNSTNLFFGNTYSIILWFAMVVSAVMSGFCFVDSIISKIKIKKILLILALCLIAIPMSSLQFSKLISIIYPVFGYIGLFLVFVILGSSIRAK